MIVYKKTSSIYFRLGFWIVCAVKIALIIVYYFITSLYVHGLNRERLSVDGLKLTTSTSSFSATPPLFADWPSQRFG